MEDLRVWPFFLQFQKRIVIGRNELKLELQELCQFVELLELSTLDGNHSIFDFMRHVFTKRNVMSDENPSICERGITHYRIRAISSSSSASALSFSFFALETLVCIVSKVSLRRTESASLKCCPIGRNPRTSVNQVSSSGSDILVSSESHPLASEGKYLANRWRSLLGVNRSCNEFGQIEQELILHVRIDEFQA